MAVMERELGQSGRWSPATATAFHFSCAAVTGGTGKVAAVSVAVSTSPQTARPMSCGCRERAVGEGREEEASALEEDVAGVGLDSWPNREWAVVDNSENRGSSRESYEEEKEEEWVK
ncbi:hypothetical protein AgCh_034521 [Apium graveolens]